MSGPVVLYGAGGHAKVVLDILLRQGVDVIAIVDDDPARAGGALLGVPIVGGASRLPELRARAAQAIVGIGDNARRVAKAAELRAHGFEIATAVHPGAIVSPHTTLAAGTVVMGGAVINPGVRIGACAIVNTGATVDHDCVIEDGAHVAPGAHVAGSVRVGALTMIGIGASVIEGVTIGARVMIGAGAVVVRDVPDDVLALGVPARVAASSPIGGAR